VKAHGGVEWSPHFTDVTPERVAEAAALGLRVGPWGLSKASDIRRMAELGVFSSTISGAELPE
jgi:glycerophosphoryl diester phosphodiesterase